MARPRRSGKRKRRGTSERARPREVPLGPPSGLGGAASKAEAPAAGAAANEQGEHAQEAERGEHAERGEDGERAPLTAEEMRAYADREREPDPDALEGFDAGDQDAALDETLDAHMPGGRRKDEHWYELVERQVAALPRPEGHDRRTVDQVFDKKTMMTLYKFLSNGVIDRLDYPVSTGKEANVFHATAPDGQSMCVKIYRTSTATFHDVLQYIQGDPRFVGIKKEKRGLVAAWAQKEYRNLGRAIDNGVRVPQPVACVDNVLLMEYIGTETQPAPRLKDVVVEDPQAVADALLADYQRLLVDARLVHADLSEFNVLWHMDAPVIIDVGQAVLLEHPMAREFYERDVRNMARFLTKMGAPTTEAEITQRTLGPKHEHFEDLL